MMAGIRGKNTKPELMLRSYLHKHGFRYRLHARDLPGSPDLLLPKYRTVIFVHGCFWHQHSGCKFAATPKANAEFWRAKLIANVERDAKVLDSLRSLGWNVIVIWECEIEAAKFAELKLLLKHTYASINK
jgi:DNA mismatch endonuclease (patch repair protein)